MTGTNGEPDDDVIAAREHPVRYALIGAAFGLLLIYLGGLIPFRILSWPIVGFGGLFVVVLTSYAVVVLWTRLAGYVRPVLSRARGHVRIDSQLGTLTRNKAGRYWETTLTRGRATLSVVIEGDDEPDPRLLAEARDAIARFGALRRRVKAYLAREADEEASNDPAMASEIRALRISSLKLYLQNPPGHVVIDFEGPDEGRFWYCDYVDGNVTRLDFDT